MVVELISAGSFNVTEMGQVFVDDDLISCAFKIASSKGFKELFTMSLF